MNETDRKKTNAQRLLLVSSSIRHRVQQVLNEMEKRGHRPLIAQEVWRSPDVQMRLYRQGRSRVTWGYHCATTPKGQPDSLAADIVDAEKAWGAGRQFWFDLIACAVNAGLYPGAYFGLAENQRKGLLDAAASGNWQSKVAIGWDAAHVEVKGVSIAQARQGVRPKA